MVTITKKKLPTITRDQIESFNLQLDTSETEITQVTRQDPKTIMNLNLEHAVRKLCLFYASNLGKEHVKC